MSLSGLWLDIGTAGRGSVLELLSQNRRAENAVERARTNLQTCHIDLKTSLLSYGAKRHPFHIEERPK